MQQNSSVNHTLKTPAKFYKADGMQEGSPEDFSLWLVGTGKSSKGKLSALKKHYETHIKKGVVEPTLRREAQEKVISTSSEIDDETGVYNKTGFKKRLKEEIARAKKEGHTLQALFVFLENTQEIRKAGTILSICARPYDIVALLDKNEFVVVLPDAGQEVLEQFWNRANQMFQKGEYAENNETEKFDPISAYAGAAEIDTRQIDASFELADKAALKARKHGGLVVSHELGDHEILAAHPRKISFS